MEIQKRVLNHSSENPKEFLIVLKKIKALLFLQEHVSEFIRISSSR